MKKTWVVVSLTSTCDLISSSILKLSSLSNSFYGVDDQDQCTPNMTDDNDLYIMHRD
jgi:hypothetical protein